MKKVIYISSVIAVLGATSAAHAECYAEYKAKRSTNGLELHYGIVQLSDADCTSADVMERAVSGRIGNDGWTLLRVVSKLDANQALDRQADAGQYYLKY